MPTRTESTPRGEAVLQEAAHARRPETPMDKTVPIAHVTAMHRKEIDFLLPVYYDKTVLPVSGLFSDINETYQIRK